jgi:Ankyrin repeats (3 copies)
MNPVPPGENEPDDVDDLYRRASAGDDSRPSEWVRSSVLTHAAHLAAERSRQKEPAGIASRRKVTPTWRRPAIFGTLAAAALAGLLIAPHFLPPPAPRVTAALQAPATPAPQAVPPQEPQGSQDALSEAVPSAPSRATRSRTEAEERSSGMLADQRPPPAAPAEEQKLAKAAGSSARNAASSAETASSAAAGNAAGSAADSAATSADSAPSVAAKNAPALVAGSVNAKRAAAAPMAAAADPAAELRQAAETGDAPKLQQLLDKQPDVDARDASGRTALLLAALHGQAHAVDVLLAHGADPNAADANGNTPLKAAIEGHQPAIAAALQRAGAR